MNLRNPPSAVMCSNDMTAIGVMREAYDHGIAIPRDLSVVGFDDIRLAQFIIPPLTTGSARADFESFVRIYDADGFGDPILMNLDPIDLPRWTILACKRRVAI